MSYNIDTVNIISTTGWIRHADVIDLLARFDDELPEGCFLRDLCDEDDADEDGRHTIDAMDWSGSGSGRRFKDVFPEVAKAIMGRVEAILVWEGGDSITGLRIVDGVMTEPAVIQTLASEVK